MADLDWGQVRDLFQRALDLPPNERAPFLNAECADAGVRAEVQSLLANTNSGLLDSPAVEGLREAIAGALSDSPTVSNNGGGVESEGTMVGRYRLLQKIGEGGMGEVWRAEQREPVRRRVALKLIKAGMNTREVIARFESERQALALMDHPAIARVFDAGSTPQGAPYFVMEYVAGVPITTYCDDHRRNTRERLELFMRVCEGVQHAHQKAIIHRDLKPSNILVTEVDGKPAPKIIDFGVAKALTQRLTAETMFTQAGMLVGTPEYMSPEQAASSGEDIDTRTDVYSLGIILYELLAGAPPIELRKIAFEEFLRRLREEEPEKPSTKIRTQDQSTSTEVAHKRRTEPAALVRQMRGDLDLIALKALDKDRSRRYGSPSDFAADIERYLKNEAVLAVTPSLGYRARKFGRRYRVALATAAAFALVLIVAAVISIRQSIRANREAAVAQAVNEFLQNDLLSQASAATQSVSKAKPDPDLKVRTALDRAAARIQGKFQRESQVEASIRDTIGRTYLDLGLYEQAREQFGSAWVLNSQVLGSKNAATLKTRYYLARTADKEGKYAESEKLLATTLLMQRQVLGRDHSDVLLSLSDLANVYREEGKYAEAEAQFNDAVVAERRALGPENPETLRSMNNLAVVYLTEGKYSQAEALYRQLLDIERRVLGPEHPTTVAALNNLAIACDEQGKFEQAETLYGQALEIERRVLGPEHPNTLSSMSGLALLYSNEGKYKSSESLGRQLVEIRRRVSPEHSATFIDMANLAAVYTAEGKYIEAELLLKQTIEKQRRILGPSHPDVLISMHAMADSYAAQGQYTQAEDLYLKTLEIRRRVLGPLHDATLYTLSSIAFLYQREGKYSLAEKFAKEDLEGQRRSGPDDRYTAGTLANIALAYICQRRFAESELLAREALAFDSKEIPDDWERFRVESVLGASLAGQKKYPEAEPLLLEGYRGMVQREERIAVPGRYHLDLAREWISGLYQAWGKPAQAAEWRQK
jgi:eukaryotic-like serine/threonine-protein kinase